LKFVKAAAMAPEVLPELIPPEGELMEKQLLDPTVLKIEVLLVSCRGGRLP